MLTERIYLSEDNRAYIDTYVAEFKNAPRDAMLIIPGGGYTNVCGDREGELVAYAYLSKGYNAFVLRYRVGEETDVYPAQLIDAAKAVLYIKNNAEKYNINSERVFAVGFSAGGHLAGSLALCPDDKVVLDAIGATAEDIKLKGVVLSYPVVTALLPTHEGSFIHLTGMPFDEIPEDLRKKYSLEEYVTKDSPPAFIWHTAEDKSVPPIGSLTLAAKYIEAGVPVSMHLYPYGCHGIALATPFANHDPKIAQPLAEAWLSDSVDFLNTIK